MARAIVHRGPDDRGNWNDGRLALGHLRLSIIDLSRNGHQPMLTASGDGVLVYNGEVYNFDALRESLRSEGRVFRTECDTEVVLQALHHWGPRKAVPLFNGMFAFAYYDLRSSELWLARDRLGIKPMSVADVGDRILFASEDKAILAADGFPRDIDTREITLRLAWQYRDSSNSLFRAIERLPPAGLWKISDAGIEKSCFWHVLDVLDPTRIVDDTSSDADHKQSLARLLRESVKLHCRADASLATACSSGVDSGVITALAKEFRPELLSYVVDPQLGPSEAERAEGTARHVGVPMRRVPLDRDRFFELWPKTAWYLESDGWHASRAALLGLVEQCRADGVKVLLTGEGADELFGGYDRQRWRMRQWYLLSWPMTLFRSKRSFDRRFLRARQTPFARSISGTSLLQRNATLRSLSPELNFLQIRMFDRLEPVAALTDRAFLSGCLFDMYSHLQDLLHRHDRLSMAASVELRVPFIENGLLDYAIHLPRRFKYRWGTGKWLLKKVAERHIPRPNVYAPKNGFNISSEFTTGTENLLRGGLLGEAMRWPATAVDDLVGMARGDEASRLRLVGMELFLRLYVAGESFENLTDRLHATLPRVVR
jgi:asparagine synthase (glutamine-hydrolysing)